MKKNLAPLVGIAFVVAIISTGIFYGLFVKPMSGTQTPQEQLLILVAARDLPRGSTLTSADVKLSTWPSSPAPIGSLTRLEQTKGMLLVADIRVGEPVTEARLASLNTGAGAGLGVPTGQRAVSISVLETAGVLSMLRPGHRVDVQAVNQRGQDTELRAIVENLQVLHAEVQGEGSSRRSVVTLLASPAEADMLTLADSGARIRLALRNPLDEQRTQRSTWDISKLLHSTSSAPPSPTPAPVPVTSAPRPGVVLWVRLAAASPAALKALGSLETAPASGNGMRISALKEGSEQSFTQLEKTHQVEVLSASELTAVGRDPVLMETGAPGDYGLRVRFTSSPRAGGALRLRVEPEVTQQANRRRLESDVDLNSGQTILITGMVELAAASSWIERTFPGRNAKPGADLMVLVTARAQP